MKASLVLKRPFFLYDSALATTFGYYAAFTLLGMMAASLGPALPGLAERTSSSLGAMRFLFSARSLGYLIGAIIGGRLYDRFSGHPIIVSVFCVLAGILTFIPTISALWVLICIIGLLGIGQSMVDVGGNTLLVWVHREKVGPFMNGLHFFFGFGAFLVPLLIAGAIVVTGDIDWAFWILALITVPVALWFLFLPSPRTHSEKNSAPTTKTRPLLVVGIGLFFFLYSGAEVGFGGWICAYAITAELADKVQAAYLTSAFWGALTIGRLLSIPFATRFKPVTLLFGNLIGCIASISFMMLWGDVFWFLMVGSIGLGFFMAAIFPTTLSFSERRMTLTGKVTSCFFVGASLGVMTISWLIGQLLESVGPHTMMHVLLGTLLSALCLLIPISRVYGTQKH